MSKFTSENFSKGFLIDEELMAGITEVPEAPGTFSAYVVRHTTGETLGLQQFDNLFEAIRTLNDIPREWAYEAISKCGSENCSKGGCGKNGGGCGKSKTASDDQSSNGPSNCETRNCPI